MSNNKNNIFSFESYDEDFNTLNRISVEHLNGVLENLDAEKDVDWAWLQVQPQQISFQHMCVRYKQSVLCILIGLVRENSGQLQMYTREQDFNNLLRECEIHHMTPCIFLISCETGLPAFDAPYMIDARTQELINFDCLGDTNNGLMSEWEINNCGIIATCDFLRQKGIENISYCDVVGISPQIFFEKDGEKSFVYVRSIPAGCDERKIEVNVEMYCNPEYKGYFVDVRWNNLSCNNGEFRDTQLFRSQDLIHAPFELIDIDTAIDLPFVKLC